jgi:hypothetical protein
LNIGAGKINGSRYTQYGCVVHVDQYFREQSSCDIDEVISFFQNGSTGSMMCRSKLFDFIDQFPFKFDVVIAERIFEHMEYTTGEIGRLLEGLNVLTYNTASLEIVVPNAIHLSNMLLNYEANCKDFNKIDSLNAKLIINTEFCNFRADPHVSVWTPELAKEYIESEGTWKVDNIINRFPFAGRDIYMKISCSKKQKSK